MEPLVIKGTEKTPEINFNAQTGKLYVGGRSYSSDAFDFYKPVTAWVNEYVTHPLEATAIDINVDYFHSVSVKYLTSIIKRLSLLQEQGKKIEVTWHHQPDQEDEDEAYDLGKSIESESRIKFRYIETAK
ncbi:MAG: DUF1987 domain-containing protein [Bacteroidia bacterium]